MELTSPGAKTLKVNSKKGAVLFDPEYSDDCKIVISEDDAPDVSQKFQDTLVIYGPGEFEVGGIMVKGTRNDDKTMYEVDTGEGKMLHALSTSISKLSTEDEYDVVVVRAVSKVEEADLSSLSSKLVVVYGPEENVGDSLKTNKINKVSLKKLEDITTNVVYLEKK